MNANANLLTGETSFRTLLANVEVLECSLEDVILTQVQGIMLQGSGEHLRRDCTIVVGTA
jgi:hypothetical protein